MTDYVFAENTDYNPASGFVLAQGKAIELEQALITDHTATGITTSGIVAGETMSFPDLCYLKSDGKYWKADANAKATTDGELAIILESTMAGATGEFFKCGYIRDDSWSFTIGNILYVDTVSGGITATRPSAIGDCIRQIGHAYSATIIRFAPALMMIEL